MTNPVIVPPDRDGLPAGVPCVFLAGPIQDGPDWQTEAAGLLHARRPGLLVASPRREYLDGEFVYCAQVDWETFALARAGSDGVVLFWLAAPAPVPWRQRLRRAWTVLRGGQLRPYAQTSRFELGEWFVRCQRDGARVVVGIEDGFSNARYIRRRFAQSCPQMPVCDTLEATVNAAVGLLAQPR